MDAPTQQVWSKTEEKWADILLLRGHDLYRLKVTGMPITLKRKAQGVLDELNAGKAPADVSAKLLATLDVRRIARAEVSPGNSSVTLQGEGEGAPKVSFSPADNSADAILQTILNRSGRVYQSTPEEIGVVEALVPPVVIGALGGLLVAGVWDSANKLAAGEALEVKGLRRRGIQRLMYGAAEVLGPGGAKAAGVALLALVVGWAVLRIVRRPVRNVWLPQSS